MGISPIPGVPLDGLVHWTHFQWPFLVIADMPKNGQNEIKLKQYTCLSGRRVFIFYFRTRCQAVWYPAYIFLLAQFGKHILVYFYKVVPSKKQGIWPKKDKKAKVLGDDSLKGLKIRQI